MPLPLLGLTTLALAAASVESPRAPGTVLSRFDTSPRAPCAVAIVGATVIDGNGGPPLADATVLVRDGKFAAVGRRADVKVPECAEVIDGTGKFVTPGFTDTNVHVAMPGGAIDFARYWDRLTDLAIEGA